MDIFKLTKSKLRAEILKLYFAKPKAEYYIRELARLLNKPAPYVRRELLNLQDIGLMQSRFRGNQRYFQLNKNYKYYKEIKKIALGAISLKRELQKYLNN